MSHLTLNKYALGRLVNAAVQSPAGAAWSAAGSYTWVAPFTGVVTWKVYGGGGGGGGGGPVQPGISGGGGGGGGYDTGTLSVTAGTSYAVFVGAGGAGGTAGAGGNGGGSTFDGLGTADGGTGGAVASGAGGAGGTGGTGGTTNGSNGDTGTTTGDGKGGAGAGPGGGAGGTAGGDLVGPASDGSAYGGGGGGALADGLVNAPGGKGADGGVELSWASGVEDVYVAGCENPCSTYYLGRWVGTISGTKVYAYGNKCCAYPAKDLGGADLTVGFDEKTNFPPGISDYLTVVLSASNCPPLGGDHCVVGEAKWGSSSVPWSPSGGGWTGTIPGTSITFAVWVDHSCANPLRFCVTGGCSSAPSGTANSDGCGSCAASPCGTPCNWLTIDCPFPLRAHISYTSFGGCCPGLAGTDCDSSATFTVVGYCRDNHLSRYLEAPQVFTPGVPTLGGPIGPSPPQGVFTYGPQCPCPPPPYCPALTPPCCDMVQACNCGTLTLTLTNGSGGASCYNGSSGSLACGTVVGSLRTWTGTVTISPACQGVTSFSASFTCDGSTGAPSLSLSAGAGCTFSGPAVSIDCVNRTITFALTGGGVTCSGEALTGTITW